MCMDSQGRVSEGKSEERDSDGLASVASMMVSLTTLAEESAMAAKD